MHLKALFGHRCIKLLSTWTGYKDVGAVTTQCVSEQDLTQTYRTWEGPRFF